MLIFSSQNNLFHILFIPPGHLEILLPLLIISFQTSQTTRLLSGNIMTQITYHFPQFLIIKQAGLSYKNCSYFKHDFSKLNEENLNDFASLDQSYMNDRNSDINAKFNRFLSSLDELVKNHAPLKKLSKRDVKVRNKPWINGRTQNGAYKR